MNKFEDPSLKGGYTQIYQIQKPFKLDNSIKSFDDTFMARVFKSPHSYKIELTSQNNVSFLYKCIVDQHRMADICNINAISLNYQQFFDWVKQMLHDELSYELNIKDQINAQLRIMKTQKFKVYEIGKLPFEIGSDEEVRENLMFRYQRMKTRKQLLTDYWNKMTNILRTKNPSLLISLQNAKKIKKAFK